MTTKNKFTFVRSNLEPIAVKPGIYHNVPFENYMRWDAFSKSMVDNALLSHAHLRAYIETGKTTRSMTLGSLVDCLVLEPHLYDKQYCEQPATYTAEKWTGRAPNKKLVVEEKPWNNNAQVCKDYNRQMAEAGRTPIDIGLLSQARSCVISIDEHEIASEIVERGLKQVSIVWECQSTGVMCKGRFDILGDGEHKHLIIDLKTTKDASSDGFAKECAVYDYHVQGGSYTEGYFLNTGEQRDFSFIAVETSRVKIMQPAVAMYGMSYHSDELKVGRLKFKRACEAVAEYAEQENMTGYHSHISHLELPAWSKSEEMKYH